MVYLLTIANRVEFVSIFFMSMCLTDCNNILMRRHWQSIQNSCSIDWVANYYARNKNHFCMQDIKLGFYAGQRAVCRAAGTYRGKGRSSPQKKVPRIEAKPVQKIWYRKSHQNVRHSSGPRTVQPTCSILMTYQMAEKMRKEMDRCSPHLLPLGQEWITIKRPRRRFDFNFGWL